jgi:hypothetical protein
LHRWLARIPRWINVPIQRCEKAEPPGNRQLARGNVIYSYLPFVRFN